MKLRQAVFAAAEMEPIRSRLFELFGLDDAYVDPGVAFFGLTNIVMALGDSFLEVVVPVKEGTTAGRLLDRRGSTCGYMLIFQVDDFAEAAQRFDAVGARKVWSYDDERATACHLHPKDVGGAIVSFDQMRPPEDWLWGGPTWRENRATDVSRVLGATMQSPDPAALAARWAEVLGRPAHAHEGGQRIDLDDGTFVAFASCRDGAGFEGIRGYTFEANDPGALAARALSLGLGDDRPMVGDVELSFAAPGS